MELQSDIIFSFAIVAVGCGMLRYVLMGYAIFAHDGYEDRSSIIAVAMSVLVDVFEIILLFLLILSALSIPATP